MNPNIMDSSHPVAREEVEALRREYAREELDEASIRKNPIDQFAIWFNQALSSDLLDPNAMSLATSTEKGIPSVRIVLLKGFDHQGFRFYTNYNSRKGRELEANPHAALCFYWSELERQVRIEGSVKQLSREESEKYFSQRPRESQLGAWASEQSRPIRSRDHLEEKFRKLESEFQDKAISTPDNWGGYILKPKAIEFWQGRPGRLHDRILYTCVSGDWSTARLAP